MICFDERKERAFVSGDIFADTLVYQDIATLNPAKEGQSRALNEVATLIATEKQSLSL